MSKWCSAIFFHSYLAKHLERKACAEKHFRFCAAHILPIDARKYLPQANPKEKL